MRTSILRGQRSMRAQLIEIKSAIRSKMNLDGPFPHETVGQVGGRNGLRGVISRRFVRSRLSRGSGWKSSYHVRRTPHARGTLAKGPRACSAKVFADGNSFISRSLALPLSVYVYRALCSQARSLLDIISGFRNLLFVRFWLKTSFSAKN